MRSRLLFLTLIVALAGVSAPALAATTTPSKPKSTHHKKKKKKGPTQAQMIATAIRNAERSPDLWATVNECLSGVSTSSGPTDYVGVRGQMPSLGFPAKLTMSLSVEYWNYDDNMFEPADATSTISLGMGSHGDHQGGVNFPFTPPAAGSQYLVRGTITFEWMMGSKVLGKVTKNTGHGYANVGYSNPPGTSEGTCTLM